MRVILTAVVTLAALILAAFATGGGSHHGGIRDQAPSWSPDGRQLVFMTNPGGSGQIWIANVDGTGHRKVTDGRQPSWSPDGTRIAFSGGISIFVVNVDGSGPRRLTETDSLAADYAPAWSPDGTRIAFYRFDQATRRGSIWAARADGSGEAQLATAGNNGMPYWSPDGRRIAFQSHRDGNWEIYVMQADGTDQRRLTRTPNRHEGEPAWSPDGRIVFSAGTGQGRDIYLMNADGSGERRLTTLRRELWSPRFSSDGTRLAFFEFPPGHLWLANADGSGVKRLFAQLSVASFSVAPKRPSAGETLAAVLRVAGPSAGAKVACRATVAGRALPGLGRSILAGRARCTWRLPVSAKGKRLRATVTVTGEAGRATRSFSAVVR